MNLFIDYHNKELKTD